jgi:ATP-binding cassette subfamily B protein
MSQLKTLLPFFRPYRRGLVAGLLLVVLANAFGKAAPYILKVAIDGLDDPATTMTTLAMLAALIVGTTALGGVCRYGMRELLNGISRRMECDLREKYFRRLLSLDARFFGQTRTGDLMARSTQDMLAARMAAGPAVMYSVNTAVGFAVGLAIMTWISPRLTLYALIPMVLVPPVVLGFGRIIHRRFERIQEQFSTVTTTVQENLTGVRIVRAYGQERAQAVQFDAENREYLHRNMLLVQAAGLFHPLLSVLTGAAMVIVLWLGGLEVMAGRLTVGDFVAFQVYLALLIWPMIALGWVVNLFQRGAASMGRINRILEREPDVAAPEHPAPPHRLSGQVVFEDVWFRYPDTKRWVLREVSFTALPGQTVAVVGGTGSGKSTLVSLIPRLYDTTRGRVQVGGADVRDYDPADLRRAVGVVPQDPFLFSDTIAENIGLGLAEAASRRDTPWGRDGAEPPEEVYEAARVAQLDESINDFPDGYGTYLGERGINLSGGQKQRATLARAVARDPVVLILDDALSAVDTHTEARILRDLRDVLARRTSFVISHRVSAVMHADLILVLEDGLIVERGTHDELIDADGVYATLLRRQMLEQAIEAEVTGD